MTSDQLSRRRFVSRIGLAAGCAPAFLRGPLGDAAERDSTLFLLGVASGDPGPSSVVIWTRLAPHPLRGGGLGRRIVPVSWQVATDPGMNNVVRQGTTLAVPENGHAVKVLVNGLGADTFYYYRFSAMNEFSRCGRTRTFPGIGGVANRMRFALASCQNYEQGYWAAFRDMADQDLDFVVHVGDYIYEDSGAFDDLAPDRTNVREHEGPEILSTVDYRNRYAQYKLDDNLKAAHARFPFICTWDDHEVDNNYAGRIPEDDQSAEEFLARTAAAYQVYYETMPLRSAQRPDGASMPLYRRLAFGDLADIHILDTRQFRTDQPCGDGFGTTDPVGGPLGEATGQTLLCGPEFSSPEAAMLGAEQELWLTDGLRGSNAAWNVLAQQVMVARWDLGPIGAIAFETPLANLFNVDAWDGYPVAQQRLLNFLADYRPNNPVVLTGDIHSSWAANLLADFADPTSDAVAAEFVSTSISSTFGDDNAQLVQATIPANPHVRHFNGFKRGYCLCEATRDRWVTEFREVDDVFAPNSGVSAGPSFLLRSGFNSAGNGGEALTRI